MDYNRQHASWANEHQPVAGKRVLVVGCNTGGDCRFFVEFGAREVHGVDVVETVGADFPHERVAYHRMSAEAMALPADAYDLVFCYATMEHVPDVAAAFREIARVTAPGGLVYCVASPLWNSRHGHHFPHYFGDFPWIHLRRSSAQIGAWLRERGVQIHPTNVDIETVVGYMADRTNFNMLPSTAYTSATMALTGFDVLRDAIDHEPADAVPPEVLRELEPKGYSSAELRAVTHTYIARKRAIVGKAWWRFWR
jgi:SAM-dependent methyltransferase